MRKQLGVGAVAITTLALLVGCSGSPAPDSEGSGAEIVIWTDAEREQAISDAAKIFEDGNQTI